MSFIKISNTMYLNLDTGTSVHLDNFESNREIEVYFVGQDDCCRFRDEKAEAIIDYLKKQLPRAEVWGGGW